MKKPTVLWIQLNVYIDWGPENIVTFTENYKLNVDFQILILTHIKLATEAKNLHISPTSMDQHWPMTKGLIKTLKKQQSSFFGSILLHWQQMKF